MAAERVVVVGTGVAGASCAYALARRGVSVTTVDSGHSGQATAAGAGIVQPWTSAAPLGTPRSELNLAGTAYYPRLLERLAADGVADIGYARSGSMVVSADGGLLDDIEARVERHRSRRPEVGDVRRLGPADARALFPPLAERLSAVHISGGARVDGRQLRLGLLAGARRHGALDRQGEAELVVEDGAVTGVRVGGETIEADVVVAAAGAWTNRLVAPLGLRVPVEPQRGQIVHLCLDGADTSGWPSIHPMDEHYIVCFEGRIVVGATRETGSGFDVRVTAGGLNKVLTAALAVAPGLAAATHLETRVGLRPLAADQVPWVGSVPGVPGLAMVTGFGASGLTMGPYSGEVIADIVQGIAPPPGIAPDPGIASPPGAFTPSGEAPPSGKAGGAQGNGLAPERGRE